MGWFDDNHFAGDAYDFGMGYMCGGGGRSSSSSYRNESNGHYKKGTRKCSRCHKMKTWKNFNPEQAAKPAARRVCIACNTEVLRGRNEQRCKSAAEEQVMALSPSVRARVSRAIGDEWKGMSWQERLDACGGARRSAVSMKTAAPKAKGEQKKRSRPSVVPFDVDDESDAPMKKQAKEPLAEDDPMAGQMQQQPPQVTLMLVNVPHNVRAGDNMVVMTPSGQQDMVVVPPGAGPGSQFQIAMPRDIDVEQNPMSARDQSTTKDGGEGNLSYEYKQWSDDLAPDKKKAFERANAMFMGWPGFTSTSPPSNTARDRDGTAKEWNQMMAISPTLRAQVSKSMGKAAWRQLTWRERIEACGVRQPALPKVGTTSITLGLQSADVSRVLSTLCVVESRLHARDVKANMSVIEKMGVSLATFEELQEHEDDRVYEEAARLLDNYFEVETSTPDME
jgi:hypothetical protein